MSVWIAAVLLIICIIGIFRMPLKGTLRFVKLFLLVLAAVALLYILATVIFLGGVN